MTNPYELPRVSTDVPAKDDAPSVGYFVGALVQLGLGAVLTIAGLVAGPRQASLLGMLLLFWGVRSVVRYQTRKRRSRRPGDR